MLLPFFVKAPRNRILFFTQRTAERLNNKAFGCNKCVNMAQEFYIKCWQFFSLRLQAWFGLLSFCSSFSTLILLGEGENALFYWAFALLVFFTFLSPPSPLNPNFNNLSPFCFLPGSLVSQPWVPTCSPLWRWKFSPAVPVPASIPTENKGEGLTSLFQRYSEYQPQWGLLCQWYQMGSRMFLFTECRCSGESKE